MGVLGRVLPELVLVPFRKEEPVTLDSLRSLIKEVGYWWSCRPIRCWVCGLFFPKDDLWNPTGRYRGRLTCSQACCELASIREAGG